MSGHVQQEGGHACAGCASDARLSRNRVPVMASMRSDCSWLSSMPRKCRVTACTPHSFTLLRADCHHEEHAKALHKLKSRPLRGARQIGC